MLCLSVSPYTRINTPQLLQGNSGDHWPCSAGASLPHNVVSHTCGEEVGSVLWAPLTTPHPPGLRRTVMCVFSVEGGVGREQWCIQIGYLRTSEQKSGLQRREGLVARESLHCLVTWASPSSPRLATSAVVTCMERPCGLAQVHPALGGFTRRKQ